MRLRVLGCSGGIGGRHLRTTSFLVDGDVLLDAGTGVGDLSLAELSLVDHIFVTHSHLDHVASIAFMVDTVGGMRAKPITVHATRETIDILQQPHLQLGDLAGLHRRSPRRSRRSCATRRSSSARTVSLARARLHAAAGDPHGAGGRLPAGQRPRRAWCSPATPGRTTRCGRSSTAWATSRYLIIETAFANKERHLAELSKHLCPSMLAEELVKFERDAEIYVTHLKPGETELTMQEIEESSGRLRPRMLQNNQVFEF